MEIVTVLFWIIVALAVSFFVGYRMGRSSLLDELIRVSQESRLLTPDEAVTGIPAASCCPECGAIQYVRHQKNCSHYKSPLS